MLGTWLLGGTAGIAKATTYTTSFPLDEESISEGGNWIGGGTEGIDWSDVAVVDNMAICTVDGSQNPAYDDSTAILTGTWGSNQTVTATLYITNQAAIGYPEAELRLRSAISPYNCTGYEILYSLKNDASCYIGIVRWNGDYGDFTPLASIAGAQYVSTNGSTLKATVVGSTITAFLNGVQVCQADDTTYTNGSPGMGFDIDSSDTDQNGTFGFTHFTATDEQPVVLVPTYQNGQFGFSFDTVAGKNYFILQFTNLAAADRGNYTIVSGTGAPYQFICPATNSQPASFFRLLIP